MLIFGRTIILVRHLVSSLSLSDCSDHRLREDSRNLWSEFVHQVGKNNYHYNCGTFVFVELQETVLILFHILLVAWSETTVMRD